MPVPLQETFPLYQADLTADNLRILQYAITDTSIGFVLYGLQVSHICNNNGYAFYKISPGTAVKDRVVIHVKEELVLQTEENTTYNIVLTFVHQNNVPQPQAKIEAITNNLYLQNPSRYIRLAQVRNEMIVSDESTRDMRPPLFVSSQDPTTNERWSPLITQYAYWLNTTQKILYRWEYDEWIPVLNFAQLTQQEIQEIQNHINATSNVHGVRGRIPSKIDIYAMEVGTW